MTTKAINKTNLWILPCDVLSTEIGDEHQGKNFIMVGGCLRLKKATLYRDLSVQWTVFTVRAI